MSNILMTLAEEREQTTDAHFAVKHKVDEYDCFDFSNGLKVLGHDVFFANWDDLSGRELTRMFHDNAKRFIAPVPLTQMDLIFVYKMEGFLFNLANSFGWLNLCGRIQAGFNDLATLQHTLTKGISGTWRKKGIQVIPTRTVDDRVRERLAGGEAFVLKPIRGERGDGVMLVRTFDELSAIKDREDEYLAQDYMPEIRDGERSLVFLGFEYQHAVLKKPSASDPLEFRCNETLGGTVAVYEPTSEELDFAQRVLKAYESLNCPFTTADDMIQPAGPTLVEAEQ